MKLRRYQQCAKCPWKVSTDPHDIPNGYCETKHAALSSTIAQPGALNVGGSLSMMACHEHPAGGETPCIGWLVNQLGPGNNIALRIACMRVEGMKHVRTIGPQHATFADTLP